MCNTGRDPNKGKEKVNEEPIIDFKTMENKRKAIVLVEPDVETNNSKCPNNGDAGEESSNSSKKISPFLLFGFIIDPNKRIKHGYSCHFCSRKFINPQALGGHQNRHRLEKRLINRVEDHMNKDWMTYSNGTRGVISQNTIIPYHGGYGYQLAVSSKFDAENLLADQGIVSPHVTMPEIEYSSVLSGGADGVDHEDKETGEEKEWKIDLTLKI